MAVAFGTDDRLGIEEYEAPDDGRRNDSDRAHRRHDLGRGRGGDSLREKEIDHVPFRRILTEWSDATQRSSDSRVQETMAVAFDPDDRLEIEEYEALDGYERNDSDRRPPAPRPRGVPRPTPCRRRTSTTRPSAGSSPSGRTRSNAPPTADPGTMAAAFGPDDRLGIEM